MIRKFAASVVAVLVCCGFAMSEDVKGKVKSVDAEKNTIVVTVGDKDMTYTVAADAKIVTVAKGKKGKPGVETPLADGLKGLKADTEVTLTTEKKDDKETVTGIKLGGGGKGKKDKKEPKKDKKEPKTEKKPAE